MCRFISGHVDGTVCQAYWSGYSGDHPLMCQHPRTWPHMTEERHADSGLGSQAFVQSTMNSRQCWEQCIGKLSFFITAW